MALNYAHGAVQWLSADGPTTVYQVTGLGFQPKAIRFHWVGLQSASDAVSEAVNENRGVGFAVSPSSRRSIGTFSQDTAGTSNCGAAARDDCVACTTDGAGASNGRLDLDAINAGGFDLIVDDAAPADLTVFWEAWGGDDITVAAVGDIAEPGATGNQDYSVPGFVAGALDQVVMFAGCQSTAALNTDAAADSGMHVGFATAQGGATVCGNSDDASTAMDTDGYCQDGECLSMIVLAGGNPNALASLTQWNTNGFRLNWSARATTNRRSVFLAIKGGNWAVGAYTIAGNSGSATTTVTLPFAPIGLSLIGRMTAEDTAATASANDRIGIGCGTSPTSRRSMGVLDENATASSACEINTTIQYDQVLSFPSTAGALLAAYDIDAMLANGFRIIVDVAGGVASEWQGYLAFASKETAADRVILDDVGQGVVELVGPAGLHIQDGPVSAALVDDGNLSPGAGQENLKISDAVTASRDLTATPGENLKITDAVTAARGLTAELAESLKIAETLAVALWLAAELAEAVKVTDTPATTLDPEEASRTEPLRITDAIAVILDPEEASPSEHVRIADAALTTLDPEQADPSEGLRIADAVQAAIDLLVAVAPEDLKASDAVAAQLDLLASLAEGLRVTDAPATVLDPEQASATDELRITDAVSASRDLEATPGEAVLPSDAVSAQPDAIASTAEALRLSETVAAQLDPLEAAPGETVIVIGTVTVGNVLIASVGEALSMGDAPLATLDPVLASASEQAKVADAVTVARDLTAELSEAARLSDAAQAARTLEVTPAEAVRLSDAVSATRDLEAAINEPLVVADALSASFAAALERAVGEGIVVSDTVSAAIVVALLPGNIVEATVAYTHVHHTIEHVQADRTVEYTHVHHTVSFEG